MTAIKTTGFHLQILACRKGAELVQACQNWCIQIQLLSAEGVLLLKVAFFACTLENVAFDEASVSRESLMSITQQATK